jgi:hypothetical protein
MASVLDRLSTHMEQGGNRSTRRKTCHGATSSTINPADTGVGSNPTPAVRDQRRAVFQIDQ